MKNFILNIVKDSNDINEKNVVGFLSFVVMVIFAFADIITGAIGKDLVINSNIYQSFLILVLGSFGISGLEKIMNNKKD